MIPLYIYVKLSYFTESVSSNLIDLNTEILQPSGAGNTAGAVHGPAATSYCSSDSSSQQHATLGY